MVVLVGELEVCKVKHNLPQPLFDPPCRRAKQEGRKKSPLSKGDLEGLDFGLKVGNSPQNNLKKYN